MSIYLLYTVGNRDLLVEGKSLEKEPQRQKGEEILGDFDSYKEKLSASQLEATINYVLRNQDKIVQLHLFVTDQLGVVEPKHSSSDTCFVGDVLKKHLALIFPTRKVSSVKVRCIKGINVALYDDIYEWFSRNLGHLPLTEDNEDNIFYLCPTAGTPAMTQGLLLNGVRLFQARCKALYLPAGGKEPIELRFASLFLFDMQKESLKRFVKKHDYTASFRLLQEMTDINWIMPEASLIEAVVKSTMHRLYFDFTTARHVLEEQTIPRATGKEREALIRARNQLTELIEASRKLEDAQREEKFDQEYQEACLELLEELFYNSRITFQNEQYIDFLGRLFRFQEAVCRYLTELHLKLPTDSQAKKQRFVQGIEQNPELISYLKEGNIDYSNMGIPTFLRLVNYLVKRGVIPGSLYEFLYRIQRLAPWRNKSIIAHGWQPINREELLYEYGGEPEQQPQDPLQDMERVLELLGRPPQRNPFDDINLLILPSLEA